MRNGKETARQIDKFKEAAHRLETDGDERFEAPIKNLVKKNPEPRVECTLCCAFGGPLIV